MKCRVIGLITLLAACMPLHGLAMDNGDGTFTNPPLYADYPDPDIIRVGDTFYFASTTFVNSPGLVLLESKDLVNWKTVGYVLSKLDGDPKYDMQGGTAYRGGVFAPSLRYHDGTFYIAVTPNGHTTRVYSSKDFAGPWKCVDLHDGAFDPGLFFDDDGTPYIFTSGAWDGTISLKTLSPQLDKVVSTRKIHFVKNAEGCKVIKAHGWYYIFNAIPTRLGLTCSRAKSLDGPWETVNAIDDRTGGHQGAIVDLPNGDFYGFVMKDSGAVGRMTNISPITWKNDWPIWGTAEAPGKVPDKAPKPIQGQDEIKRPVSTDFDKPALDLNYQWNHNPDDARWSLTERPGFLRLKATTAADLWNARNTLTHKGWGPTSCAVVKVDTSHLQLGDNAGLGVLGASLATLTINRATDGAIKLDFSAGLQKDGALAHKSSSDLHKADTIYLALQMDLKTSRGRCGYSIDGKAFTAIGDPFELRYDWASGTFQGVQYAVFCFNPQPSEGYLDVDSVCFEDVKIGQ